MTKLWGPLGWMTLHSVSLIYPESPSLQEKQLVARFLDLFAETISCIHCKLHFKNMKTIYISMYPNFLDSRQNFAMFVFRAHNTVNKRIDKPRPSTVSECLQMLKIATSHTSFAVFRNSYLSYLTRNWGRDYSGEGRIIINAVNEMIKINNEYFSPRERGIPELIEDDITRLIERSDVRITYSGGLASVSVGFKGGRLQLKRN
jgi:UDP-galactopyranose mutase